MRSLRLTVSESVKGDRPVSAILNDLRNPHVRIFLSYIFLSAKPEQENVGEADIEVSETCLSTTEFIKAPASIA